MCGVLNFKSGPTVHTYIHTMYTKPLTVTLSALDVFPRQLANCYCFHIGVWLLHSSRINDMYTRLKMSSVVAIVIPKYEKLHHDIMM